MCGWQAKARTRGRVQQPAVEGGQWWEWVVLELTAEVPADVLSSTPSLCPSFQPPHGVWLCHKRLTILPLHGLVALGPENFLFA